MENYCKNCGANISGDEMFCPDCGKRIPEGKNTIRYCPNCGEKIASSDYFCKNCGSKIKTPKKESPGFLDRYRTPVIIIAVIFIVAIVAFGASTLLSPGEMEQVQVDTFNFNIPGHLSEDEDMAADETDDGTRYVSKYWQSEEDFVQIDVTYIENSNEDLNDIIDYMDGKKRNLMGYDGYLNEFDDFYSFSFVKDNKVVSVYTSNMSLFDEIEVL